jgi:hypothetical protein
MGSTLGACGDVNRNVMGPAGARCCCCGPSVLRACVRACVCSCCVRASRPCSVARVCPGACSLAVAAYVALSRRLANHTPRHPTHTSHVTPNTTPDTQHTQRRTPTGRSMRMRSSMPTTSQTCWRRSRAHTMTCGSTARSLCRCTRRCAPAVWRSRQSSGGSERAGLRQRRGSRAAAAGGATWSHTRHKRQTRHTSHHNRTPRSRRTARSTALAPTLRTAPSPSTAHRCGGGGARVCVCVCLGVCVCVLGCVWVLSQSTRPHRVAAAHCARAEVCGTPGVRPPPPPPLRPLPPGASCSAARLHHPRSPPCTHAPRRRPLARARATLHQFLPRKFKVAVTVPGDNSVDILTNDIGVVVITDPASGELQGFDLLVGGGMGRTHRCVRPGAEGGGQEEEAEWEGAASWSCRICRRCAWPASSCRRPRRAAPAQSPPSPRLHAPRNARARNTRCT